VKSFGSKCGFLLFLSLWVTFFSALAGAQQIAFTPSTLDFGSVGVGSSKTQTVVVKNITKHRIGIFQASVSGTGYAISGISCPVALPAGQSMSFSVTFTPLYAGTASGLVSLVTQNWWKERRVEPSTSQLTVSGSGVVGSEIVASPASVAFGNVIVGNSQTMSVLVTNSGGSTVTISNAAATGTGFSFNGPTLPATLTAGQSATFNAVYTPTVAGNSSGNLTITSDASNPTLTVPLTGVGVTQGQVTPNPVSLSFGNVATGSSKTLPETLTNSGGTSLTISAAAASGTGFTISGITLPLTLNAGQSTSFNVQFAPTATGAASGNVTITSNGSNPTLNIALSGTGVTAGTLSANPTSLSFGNVTVNTNSSLPETLTNTGGVNVTISQATVTGAGFSVSGLTLPVTLTPSQSVAFSVKFAPTAAGAVSGNLAIVSDASNSPLNITLTGTGVTPGQLTPNPTSLSFGNVTVGSSKSLPETLTNSGGSSLTISAASATGSGYSISGLTLPLTLTAGQSTSFTVKYAPTAAGAASGNVAITSNGGNPNLNIGLTGTGVTPGTLSANPTSISFGTVQVGSTGSQSETLTNTGGSAVTISQANITGTGFSITGLTLPTTLNAGQSVTFTTKFTPAAPGAVTGNLAIVSDASNSPLNIGMSGTGGAPGTLSVNPPTLSFGNVVVNVGKPLTGSLNATGASVTVTSGTSDSSEFVLSGITFPKTIAAGQSTSFTVTFTPNASGAASASLTFASNASNSPTVEALTGTGVNPQPHSVDLTWTASQSSGVVGYNIYRSIVSGSGYTKVNGTVNSDTSYTDTTVTAGLTYFYVAKAVDGNDVESGPSNEVQAVIPTP
jgi:ASPM-SPD-2-Hydin domain-containing protein/centrosomal CEP192-like protein/HYDIN/CFA65/VesB family protein